MRILFIEDDRNISSIVLSNLRNEGFSCDECFSGEDGLQMIKLYKYDCLVLDLMLPDISGVEVLRRMRMAKNNLPVIVMSGLSEVSERIHALSSGADDYVNKPCNIKELIARIHAVVRRNMGYFESKIQVGRISINLQTKTAKADGIPLKITSKEYAILELLILKRGHALTKEAFLEHLYDESCNEPTLKIVDVFVCKLRAKIKEALNSDKTYIETIWGRGYTFVNPEENQADKLTAIR